MFEPFRLLRGHARVVHSIGFSPDKKLLASASDDKTVRLWNLESGEEQARFQGAYVFKRVAFSPDGRLLAAGDEQGKVHLWKAPTAREV